METTAGAPAPSESTNRLTLIAGLVLLLGSVVLLWQAPGAYDIYLALHVAFAVVWVGGGVAVTVIALLAERTNDPRELAVIVKYAEKLGQRVFTPSGVIVFVLGVALVEKGDWGWGIFWLDFALVVWALSFAVGAGFLGPTTKKIHKAYEASGGQLTPEITALQRQVIRVIRFDAVLLLLIVVDMAAKPTF